MDRALRYGRRCREFDSLRGRMEEEDWVEIYERFVQELDDDPVDDGSDAWDALDVLRAIADHLVEELKTRRTEMHWNPVTGKDEFDVET